MGEPEELSDEELEMAFGGSRAAGEREARTPLSGLGSPSGSMDALEELELLRERDLLEHIKTVEDLANLQQRHEAVNQANAMAVKALAAETLARKAAEATCKELRQQLKKSDEGHAHQVAELRDMYAVAQGSYGGELLRVHQMYEGEIAGMRAKIAELKAEIAGLLWTDRHRAEAATFSADETLQSMLIAASSAVCEGLARHLQALLEGEESGAAGGWAENSGWAQRVCRHMEETQGSLQSSDACSALAAIPALVPTMLASDVFAIMYDVCRLQPSPSRDADGSVAEFSSAPTAPVRFQRTPQDWARFRLNAALTIRHCLEERQAHWTEAEQVSKVVSAPQALRLLLDLTTQETAGNDAGGGDTMRHCTWCIEALAQFFPHHDGIASAFYACDGIAVMGQLLAHQAYRASSLRSLNLFAHDATRGDLCAKQGLPQPLVDVLRQEGLVADAAALQEALRLLAKLTHSQRFAEQLVALDVHVPLLHICSHATEDALVFAKEVLVNVLLLCPQAAPSFTQSGVFQCIVGLLTLATDRKNAVLTRAMDVVSQLMKADPKLAADVPLPVLQNLGRVAAGQGMDVIAYKTSFFLYNFYTSEAASLPVLCHPDAFGLLISLRKSHSYEVRGWLAHCHLQLAQRCLAAPQGVATLDALQRDQLRTAAAGLLGSDEEETRSTAAIALLALGLVAIKAGDAAQALGWFDEPTVALVRAGLELNPGAEVASLLHSLCSGPGVSLVEQLSTVVVLLTRPEGEVAVEAAPQSNVDRSAAAVPSEKPPSELGRIVDDIVVAVWCQVDAVARLDELAASGWVGLIVEVTRALPGGGSANLFFELLTDESSDFASETLEQQGITQLAALMRRDNKCFARGARVLARLLAAPGKGAATLEQAGLALMVDTLAGVADEEVKAVIAGALPAAFDRESVCLNVCHSGVVSYVIALVDTAPSELELQTALDIIAKIIQWPSALPMLVRYGGLRVLVELSLIQQFAAEDFGLDEESAPTVVLAGPQKAQAALLTILAHGDTLVSAIAAEGGVPLLRLVLEQSESDTVVEQVLGILAGLASTSAAAEMLSSGAAEAVADWLNHPMLDVPDRTREWSDRVRKLAGRILVDLAWNVQSSRRGTSGEQDTLSKLVSVGALPALLQASEVAGEETDEDREQRRRAMWALATWLSFDDVSARSKLIRAGGMVPLLRISEANATPEVQRYARVALSKILSALGDELSVRITVLRAQMNQAEDPEQLWEALAASLGSGGSRSPAGIRSTDANGEAFNQE